MLDESISIKNFTSIKDFNINLGKLNVFIGPQATGKSITVKLLYFFKSFVGELFKTVEAGGSKRDFDKKLKNNFISYFPKEGWGNEVFKIKYKINEFSIEVNRNESRADTFTITYTDNYKKIFNYIRKEKRKIEEISDGSKKLNRVNLMREVRNKFDLYLEENHFGEINLGQLFIPAGRSFFSNLQSSIFSFMSNNNAVDPFLQEFGSYLEGFKSIQNSADKSDNEVQELIDKILCGRYEKVRDKDYLILKNNRKVALQNSSSGQQESFPLSIILKLLPKIRISHSGQSVYIEEPEAHLFPIAQKQMVELISTVFNLSGQTQFFITTHSPYILTSINNLLQAGEILTNEPKKSKELFKIIKENTILRPYDVHAYALDENKSVSICCEESGLIDAESIDAVSETLAIEFDSLLDLDME